MFPKSLSPLTLLLLSGFGSTVLAQTPSEWEQVAYVPVVASDIRIQESTKPAAPAMLFFDVSEAPSAPSYPDLSEALARHLQYPPEAEASGVEGRVLLEVHIDAQGNLGRIVRLQELPAGCTEAAEAAVRSLGSWTPARQYGREVAGCTQVEVLFKLP